MQNKAIYLLACHFLSVLFDSSLQFVALIKLTSFNENSSNSLNILYLQLFQFLPCIIFSSFAGQITDKFNKSYLLKIFTLVDLFLSFILIKLISEQFSSSSLYFLVAVRSILNTFYYPTKLGLIPKLTQLNDLTKANSYFQSLSVVGGILGTLLGSLILNPEHTNYLYSVCLFNVFFSLAVNTKGVTSSDNVRFKLIPSKNDLKSAMPNQDLLLSNLAIALFWALGVNYKLATVILAENNLSITNKTYISFLLVCIGAGLMIGSVFVNKASNKKVEIGLVPIGSISMAVSSLLLACFSYNIIIVISSLFVIGISAAFFIIPLSSYIQNESDPRVLGRTLAYQNQLTYILILLISITTPIVINFLKLNINYVFYLGGIIAICISIFLLTYIPHMLIRFINWMLINSVYKVKIISSDNIPQGGALLIANHISYVDAALIQASVDRPIKFIMHKPIYDNKLIHPIVKKLSVIPIESGKKDSVEQALEEAKQSLINGELVCIFPEGAISRIGVLQPFKRGMERIMNGLIDIPIIPVYLDQVWGSIFSFKGGKVLWKIPREVPYPVTITFGKSLSSNTSSREAYIKMEELGMEVYQNRKELSQNISYRAIKSLRRNLFKTQVSDSLGNKINNLKLLCNSLYLSTIINKQTDKNQILIHLPNGIPSLIVNLSIQINNKISVNLNGTVSKDSQESIFSQLDSDLIITNKAYLEKQPLLYSDKYKVIYIEDLIKNFSSFDKIKFSIFSTIIPTILLTRLFSKYSQSPDEVATILFSSGSTGIPKGVMLTHKNIISNVKSVSEIYETDEEDCILGCLPFFHSFGFTFTLWFPILEQIKVAYHHNPLDADAIQDLIKNSNSTLLFSTPTFLRLYLSKWEKEKIKSLSEILVGAEKLPSHLAQKFCEKFNITPKEGYGTTELSPLALVNIRNYSNNASKQKGEKEGTVGLPIPGVCVKIVNPETLAEVDVEEEGLLIVKGPNIMKGYLNQPDLTNDVIKDGWYLTGDIAKRDSEGFVTISGRLSRFAKIGGEMIPLVKLEEEINKIIGSDENCCVAISLPDNQKGEKICLLVKGDFSAEKIIEGLKESGIPNLWIPKKINIRNIDAIPCLATGKTDFVKCKELLLQ